MRVEVMFPSGGTERGNDSRIVTSQLKGLGRGDACVFAVRVLSGDHEELSYTGATVGHISMSRTGDVDCGW